MDSPLPPYVGIVGSRRRSTLLDRRTVYSIVAHLNDDPLQPIVIVSGGAAGPDTFAEEAARVYGNEFVPIRVPRKPDIQGRWEFTRRAFHRNGKVAVVSDMLYALVSSDRTGGTENTIGHALALGRLVITVNASGEQYIIHG